MYRWNQPEEYIRSVYLNIHRWEKIAAGVREHTDELFRTDSNCEDRQENYCPSMAESVVDVVILIEEYVDKFFFDGQLTFRPLWPTFS